MPNAQKALSQPRSMTLPPVTGMISGNELEEPGAEPVADGAGEEDGDGVGVTLTVVSTTVMWKLPNAVLPAVSVAKQLTVVVPTANVEPEGGKQMTDTLESTLSVAEAE